MDLLLWTDTYRTTTKSLTAKFPTDEIVSIGPSISQSTSERSKAFLAKTLSVTFFPKTCGSSRKLCQ
jgi:hypothetical protein